MKTSMYQTSVPTFTRVLNNLAAILEKGAAHADARKIDPTVLLNARLFPDVERLTGDRDGGLEPLRGRRWDAVVDTSGYVPRVVRQTAELLRDSGGYVFVSSGSVYPLHSQDRSETGPLDRMDDPSSEDVQAHYGPLKGLCEEVVTDTFGERALVVRSGLIVGPFDPTGGNLRLTIFTTGARNATQTSVVIGGRVVHAESVMASPDNHRTSRRLSRKRFTPATPSKRSRTTTSSFPWRTPVSISQSPSNNGGMHTRPVRCELTPTVWAGESR